MKNPKPSGWIILILINVLCFFIAQWRFENTAAIVFFFIGEFIGGLFFGINKFLWKAE